MHQNSSKPRLKDCSTLVYVMFFVLSLSILCDRAGAPSRDEFRARVAMTCGSPEKGSDRIDEIILDMANQSCRERWDAEQNQVLQHTYYHRYFRTEDCLSAAPLLFSCRTHTAGSGTMRMHRHQLRTRKVGYPHVQRLRHHHLRLDHMKPRLYSSLLGESF